jgi:putative peptidoglycan lipid II flippase
VFWNLAIIAGLVVGVPRANGIDAQLYVYAGAILVGTVIQLFLPFPWLRALDGRLQMVLDWRDPAVRQVFKLMIPVTIGLGLINFNAVVDSIFASRLIDPTLSPSAIDKAFRIYMLPQGVFSVAVATVLFPLLSRLATRGDMDGFRQTVGRGIRQIAFLLVPASAFCAVLAQPIVRLLYQRGEFTPAQTPVVAASLAAFSLGLTFNGFMLMLNRAFFSLQANWLPLVVALGNLGLNALLDAAFYRFGTWGIPLSTSLVNIAGTIVLIILLERRIGGAERAETARATALIVVATGVLAGVGYGIWWGLDDLLGRSLAAQIVSVGAALAAGSIAYLVSCRLLRVRELDSLLSLRRRPDGA